MNSKCPGCEEPVYTMIDHVMAQCTNCLEELVLKGNRFVYPEEADMVRCLGCCEWFDVPPRQRQYTRINCDYCTAEYLVVEVDPVVVIEPLHESELQYFDDLEYEPEWHRHGW